MARRANKYPPDLVGKLDDGEEVADAESKAHLVFCPTTSYNLSLTIR